MGLGVNLIILGAGLQNIPVELYEASSLDGANRVRQFFSITLPLLSPTIFFVTVLTTISALQMFDLVFVMLGSVNNTAIDGSKTIVYLFYEAAFVPAFFAQWAPILCEAAGVAPGHRVLDVACGTGIVTRTAADWVAPAGRAVGRGPRRDLCGRHQRGLR